MRYILGVPPLLAGLGACVADPVGPTPDPIAGRWNFASSVSSATRVCQIGGGFEVGESLEGGRAFAATFTGYRGCNTNTPATYNQDITIVLRGDSVFIDFDDTKRYRGSRVSPTTILGRAVWDLPGEQAVGGWSAGSCDVNPCAP